MSRFQDDWQSQTTEPIAIDARARAFRRTLVRRNVVEYIAGAVVIVAFLWIATWMPDRWSAGAALLGAIGGAATTFGVWKMHPKELDPSQPTTVYAAALDAERARQADAAASAWAWYVGPLLPVFIALPLSLDPQLRTTGVPTTLTIAVLAANFAVSTAIAVLNRWTAHKLRPPS